MSRTISGVITTFAGDRIVIGEAELFHALENYNIPPVIFLEFLELILKDPSDVFLEEVNFARENVFYYRKEGTRYYVAVVKKLKQGLFFCSSYPTGLKIKKKHKQFKKVK